MLQKARRKPTGFQEIFVQNDGKCSVKIFASELISGYLAVSKRGTVFLTFKTSPEVSPTPRKTPAGENTL